MPTLNQKLLLRVLAVAILLGSGLAVLHFVQAGRTPEALLWQANAAAEKGKTDKAIFYMKQYLELRPDDHDTAIKLADMMVEHAVSSKDLTNAHFLYERILRESPDRTDVGRKLVALCLRLGRYGDALTHAERILKSAPTDGLLLAQAAESLLAQNRPSEARPMFEKAITYAPDNIRSYDLYARLLIRQANKPDEARVVLDRMVQANPGDPEAFLVRARFLKQVDRSDECMRDLDSVFLLDPENGEALIISAEILQARGEIRQAKEALREAIALYPRYAQGYRSLSWLELLSGNEADALATLERGVAMIPDSPELLTPLADLWVEQGEFDRVENTIQKLEARKDAGSRVSYLRGRLLMKRGKWNEALSVLEGLRTEATVLPGLTAQLNLLIAGCHERRGDRDAQLEALKRAQTSDPHHLGVRVALANAYLSAGRFEDALKEYQVASRSPFAGLGVQVTYAQLRISWARVADAPPDEWTAIGTFLTKLREKHALAVEPPVLTGDWLASRGDFAGAIRALRAEVAARPGDPRLWSALAGTLDRARGSLAAAEAVSEGQLAAGESVELRLARRRAWADDLQPGREQRLARLEELSPTVGDADRARLLSGLAELYATIRDEAGQKRVLNDLAARYPQDLPSRKRLYAIALRAQDAATQTQWRDELRRLDGTSGATVMLLDALHALRGKATPAQLAGWQDQARAIVTATPDNIEAHLVLGYIAEQRGDPALAARHFETAADLDPNTLSSQEARLAYYLRAGQDEAARRTLGRLEADPRLGPQRFRAIVEGAVSQGGPEALTKCIGWLAAHLKREPRSAVWAGRQLEIRGKVIDALALYRQATEAHPTFADGWSARLLASAKLGDSEVNDAMAGAAKALDRRAFFAVCAECGSAVRAKLPSWSPPITTAEDRRTYAEACLSACEARGRLEDAVPIVTSIADDRNGRPEDVAWAKRTLAALTAAIGASDQRGSAMNVLRHGGEQPTSIAEARSRAAALAVAFRSVSGDDRRIVVREMIGLYTFIVRDTAATSSDWFQLAQLHRIVGDRVSCRKCLQELMKREPRNLFYVAVNVDDLLGESKLDEARPLVARLADGAQDVRVASAAARYHTLANEPQQALGVLDRYVRAADAGTSDGISRQRQAAELLDQLSRVAAYKRLTAAKPLLDASCERYRASLRAFPEAVIPMAALLAFHGQVDPAFVELEKQKNKLSTTALVTGGVSVLRCGLASPRQFQTVKAWIDDALVTSSDAIPLKLSLGELHALRQDFATAEQVYRDVLKTDPKNLVALNNLAWILAPRPETADQALKFADRAIELYGATGEMLDTRARILISAGKYDRAVSDLTDAINQSGTPLRYFHLAVAQLRMSKPEDAVRTFREARARGLDPKVIHPHDLPTFKALSTQADGVQ